MILSIEAFAACLFCACAFGILIAFIANRIIER